jgi:hypothetical protein
MPASPPVVQPEAAPGELRDRIRVPLHRLWADAGYLIGRAKAGDTDLAVHTIKTLCDELERAIREALASPPPAEMKTLSDEELDKLHDNIECWSGFGLGAQFNHRAFGRAIERALAEKNGAPNA